ncbi:hypothetical protein IWZ03DRAFT_419031 [Phyllosticta citriasiana]|uniref:Uncharacterized protein n=1 Tax=Phyllosticta citriasiana TaxID=595635 RepID=A0ABR1KAD9_9PEZI
MAVSMFLDTGEVAMAQPLIHEFVFLEWIEPSDSVKSTLGSLSSINNQDTAVKLMARVDEESSEACLYLATTIRVQSAKGPRRRQVFLGIPLSAVRRGGPDVQKFSLSDIQEPMIARAIQTAGLSEAGHVLRVTFHLETRQDLCVSMPAPSKFIKPCSRTASELLNGLKSLSTAKCFTAYMKWSSYAQVSLNRLKHKLPSLIQDATAFVCEHSKRPAKPLDWANVQWKDLRQAPPPPAYSVAQEVQDETHAPPQPPALKHDQIQVPRSSPLPRPPVLCPSRRASPCVAETPLSGYISTPTPPSSLVFIPRDFKQWRHRSPTPTEVVPHAETDDLAVWIVKLGSYNVEPYMHRRLQPHCLALGHHMRNGDVEAARRERARCTTLACFDPCDDATDEQLEQAADMLVKVMELIIWINRLHEYGDLDLFHLLWELGRAVRDAARLARVLGISPLTGGSGILIHKALSSGTAK